MAVLFSWSYVKRYHLLAGYFLKVTPRKRKIKKILRWAHENFQSPNVPQYLYHTVVQTLALSVWWCISVRQAAVKAIWYFFHSAIFACL